MKKPSRTGIVLIAAVVALVGILVWVSGRGRCSIGAEGAARQQRTAKGDGEYAAQAAAESEVASAGAAGAERLHGHGTGELGPLVLHRGTVEGLGSVRNLFERVRNGEVVTVRLAMPDGSSLRTVFGEVREIDADRGIVRGVAADYPMSSATFSFVRTGIAGQIDLPTAKRSWNVYHREQGPPYAEEIDTEVLARMECGTCAQERARGSASSTATP